MTASNPSEFAIQITDLGKCYQIYDKPSHRLQEFILPHWNRLRGRTAKPLYREFWAIKNLSLTVNKGEVFGIVGRNGSGKSTLLQIISGTLAPTTGQVETHGRVAALLELGSGFNLEFTGRENVFMNGTVLGLSEQEIIERFDEIAAFADIGDFIEQPVKTYSSGMMMRLAFAVSVCIEPDVLIIDEALAVGDAAFQLKCLERMKRLTASGTTLLFVSHDMGMVKSFCHKVLYLERGKEKMLGQPDIVAEHYFLDLRDEQRRYFADGVPVFRKKALGNSGYQAFGTEQGRIVTAEFLPDGGLKTVIGTGETIRLRIEVEYLSSLSGAALSVVVMDRRMLDITGKFFFLKPDSEENGKAKVSIYVEFECRLWPGAYFITLRLENRGIGRNFLPVDKQPAALAFDVMPYDPDFLGLVDIGMRQVQPAPASTPAIQSEKKRVVALLAVRNESLYLRRCLDHLYQQGIETCLIDNDSTDDTVKIANEYLGKGVFRIVNHPYPGYFDWAGLISLKETLAEEIETDWFIHQDADEILEAPYPHKTLLEAITEIDRRGYNTLNFDEYVFIPGTREFAYEGTDYVATMCQYYFYEPNEQRLQRAWKKQPNRVDLSSRAGHRVNFEGKHVFPENFRLRHYIVLSYAHLLKKYGTERTYSRQEVEDRLWHGARARFNPDAVKWPRPEELLNLKQHGWDRSMPYKHHPFFGQ